MAFSQNGDGRNDVFRILTPENIDRVRFIVFNRRGEKVFEINDIKIGRDGTYKGVQQDIGVYTYLAEVDLNSNQMEPFSGNVTLAR